MDNPIGIIVAIALGGLIVSCIIYMRDAKKRTEAIYMILGCAGFIAFLIPAIWLTVGTATGQSAPFSLIPLIVFGAIMSLVARRVYVVHNKRYGSYPA